MNRFHFSLFPDTVLWSLNWLLSWLPPVGPPPERIELLATTQMKEEEEPNNIGVTEVREEKSCLHLKSAPHTHKGQM